MKHRKTYNFDVSETSTSVQVDASYGKFEVKHIPGHSMSYYISSNPADFRVLPGPRLTDAVFPANDISSSSYAQNCKLPTSHDPTDAGGSELMARYASARPAGTKLTLDGSIDDPAEGSFAG